MKPRFLEGGRFRDLERQSLWNRMFGIFCVSLRCLEFKLKKEKASLTWLVLDGTREVKSLI